MVRWLRVLQREHYEPSSMRRFLAAGQLRRWPWQINGTLQGEAAGHAQHVLIFLLVVTTILRVDVLIVVVTAAYGCCVPGTLYEGSHEQTALDAPTNHHRAGRDAALRAVGVVVSLRPSWLAFVAMVWAVPVTLDVTLACLRLRASSLPKISGPSDCAPRPGEAPHCRDHGFLRQDVDETHLFELLAIDGG